MKIFICKQEVSYPYTGRRRLKQRLQGMKERNTGRKTKKENCWIDHLRYKVSNNMFKIILLSNTVLLRIFHACSDITVDWYLEGPLTNDLDFITLKYALFCANFHEPYKCTALLHAYLLPWISHTMKTKCGKYGQKFIFIPVWRHFTFTAHIFTKFSNCWTASCAARVPNWPKLAKKYLQYGYKFICALT